MNFTDAFDYVLRRLEGRQQRKTKVYVVWVKKKRVETGELA